MGVCSIPRTATPEHLKQNFEVFDFKLSDDEMAELKKLNAHQHARGESATRAEVGRTVRRAGAYWLS